MIRKALIPALALSAIGTTPALAEEHVWRVGDGFTVRTADLDLAGIAGRAALLRRLEHAGREMCREVTPRVDRRACESETLDSALASAPGALRTAIAAARIERDAPRLAGR